MSQARRIYNTLLESGELTTLYSSMKGEWSKDSRKFLHQYEEFQKLINDSGVIDLDDIDEFTGEL